MSPPLPAGEPSRKLPHQHRPDAHPHHHLCSQEGQEPEEEGSGCRSGHGAGVLRDQHGAAEATGASHGPWGSRDRGSVDPGSGLFGPGLTCLVCLLCQQEALTKAAGKKSKTPVELDLGDMLAALAKQQQALKARQLTNTKPLSFTGTLDYRRYAAVCAITERVRNAE